MIFVAMIFIFGLAKKDDFFIEKSEKEHFADRLMHRAALLLWLQNLMLIPQLLQATVSRLLRKQKR